jgi:regulator of extracellular matrix RemA (YlzA/DUF370 family)
MSILLSSFCRFPYNVGLRSKSCRFKIAVMEPVNVGFGNIIAGNRVIGMVSPNSAPVKRAIQDGRNRGIVIDMTNGRKTRAAMFTDSGHIILAAITPETVAARIQSMRGYPMEGMQPTESD